MGYHWCALHVQPRHEFRVFERLTDAAIELFLPATERISKWSDRNKRIRLPLFPGYLFVHIDDTNSARLTILKTKGVVRILGTNSGEPESVPDEQILCLKRIVEAGVPIDIYPYLQEGHRVKIVRGALAGVEGILTKKVNDTLLVISIDILQRSTSITIAAADIETV